MYRGNSKVKTKKPKSVALNGLRHIPTTRTYPAPKRYPYKVGGDIVSDALHRVGYTRDQIKELIKEGRVFLSCSSERVAVKPSQELYVVLKDE